MRVSDEFDAPPAPLVPSRETGIVRHWAPGPTKHPALLYLASLSSSSRRTMGNALDAIAQLVTGDPVARALDIPWAEVRYEHSQYLRTLLAERYAPATANRHLSALRGVLREAWRLGQVTAEDYHRAIDVKPVRGSRLPAGRALGVGEIRALFGVCGDDVIGLRNAALVAILYGAGLRRAEAVALDVEDFDADEGLLRVRHGKGNKQRTSYLATGGVEVIERWLEQRGDGAGPLLRPITRGGRVLDRRMSAQTVLDALRALAKKAGVSSFSPHDLRRSWASDLLDAGADVVTVSKLAGHASSETTGRYDRRPETAKRKASQLLHLPIAGR